jgi:hypothetical protein
VKLTIFDPHLVVDLTCFVDVTAEVGSCPRKCVIRKLDSVEHFTSFVARDAIDEIVVMVVGVVMVVVGFAVDVVVVGVLLSECFPVLSIRLLGIPPLLEEGSGGIPPLSSPGHSATNLRRIRGHSATVIGLAGVMVGGGR